MITTITGLTGPTYSKVDEKLLHLQAMLAMTHGGAHEAFDGMAPRLRDNFLGGCAQAVDEVIALMDHSSDILMAFDRDLQTAMTA
jgi:hypothetical protein